MRLGKRAFAGVCVLALSSPGGLGCKSDHNPAESASQVARLTKLPRPPPTPEARVSASGAEANFDCDHLRELGQHDLTDAGLFPLLCPQVASTVRELRAALNLIDTQDGALQLLEQRSSASRVELDELRSLARLATSSPLRFAPPAQQPPALPAAESALLSPLSPAVLVTLAHATRRLTTGGLSGQQRLRARAISARTYIEAIRALGLNPDEELSPLAKRLAGPALAHGLAFCRGYWQLGGRRLNARAREVEMALLDIVRAVDRSAPFGLDAQVIDAHHRTWRYLQQRDVRRRIDAQLTRREKRAMGFERDANVHGVESLASFPRQLERLVLSGLPDLAIDEALRVAASSSAYGIDPVETHLLTLLAQNGFSPTETRARKRFDQLRSRRHPPSALGPMPYEAGEGTLWPALDEIKTRFDGHRRTAATSTGLQKEHALTHARLLLRCRPDVEARLIEDGEAIGDLGTRLSAAPESDADAVQRRAWAVSEESKTD